jgi:hypothetical protein
LKVRLAGGEFRLPRQCACCLRETSDEKPLSMTKQYFVALSEVEKGLSLSVPYCRPCQDHAYWHARFGLHGVFWSALFLALLSVVGAVCVYALVLVVDPDLQGPKTMAGSAVPFVVGLGLYVRRRLSYRPRAPLDRRHASAVQAIDLSDFTGEAVTLDAANEEFGKLLLAMNPGVARRA